MSFDGFERKHIKTSEAQINVAVGGSGAPLLLLHGYPQTHLMWRKIAPRLAAQYTVVCPDLRGYGASSAPPTSTTHEPYSKRKMALDQVEVMESLGFRQFCVAGHDRGGRVGHRMAADYRERVQKLAVLDIVPTQKVYSSADWEVATAYYHWFFLIQPEPLPERLIGADPELYLRNCIRRWASKHDAFEETVLQEYLKAFCRPETIHATCEDYRAGATIDLQHDAADVAHKLTCPVLALWAQQGFSEKKYDVLATWRERAMNVSGRAIPDCGHFLPEEQPEVVLDELVRFFG